MDESIPAAYGFSEDDFMQMLRQIGVPTSGRLQHEEIDKVIKDLPALKEEDLVSLGKQDAACPICMTPFLALLAEEEMALAMDSPAYSSRDLGVTKLAQTCGHVFCRKDISKWILGANDSCPLCRQALFPGGNHNDGPPASGEPTDGTGPRVAPELHETGPQELLEQLFRQGNMFINNPAGRGPREDADEYSGMYS